MIKSSGNFKCVSTYDYKIIPFDMIGIVTGLSPGSASAPAFLSRAQSRHRNIILVSIASHKS